MVKYEIEPIDFEEYERKLGKRGYIWVDEEELVKAQRNYKSESSVLGEMANDVMKQRSACAYPFMVKGAIIQYLQKVERCPAHYFQNKKSDSESLDIRKCLTPLQQNGYADEFLSYYIEHRSSLSKSNTLNKLLERLRDSETSGGLKKMRFNVVAGPNFRFNYENENIISQIPKRDTSCITAPEGYCLVWGDFAQSDFRIAYNLFLRNEENDRMMAKYEDKYEALARIVAKSLGKEFDKDKFTEDRKLYKRLTLATMYGTRSSVVQEENEFISTFTSFLRKCPKYVEYYEMLESYHDMNLPIVVKTYFGNEQMSPIIYSKSDTVNRALNCPIQSTTSELVVMTVNKIIEEFQNLGYGEDDVSVYLVRHDEPVFLVKKEALKDAWIFEQYSEIVVDGWSPLALDFSFGYHYGKVDEELEQEAARSIEMNKGRVCKVECTAGENTYFPIDRVLQLQVYSYFVGEIAVFTVYNQTDHQVYYGVAQTSMVDEVLLVVRKMLHEVTIGEHYKGVVVLNTNYDGRDCTKDGVQIVYKSVSSGKLENGNKFAKYAVCRYCKSNGLQSPTNPPLASDANFINSAVKFDLLE